MTTPTARPLKVYAFDPNRGRTLGNYMTVSVPYEPLKKGPVGHQLAVVDYDASEDRYYRAVDLESPEVLIGNGLDPSESDPRFHQQMVYAIARQTVHMFEVALGRRTKWAFTRWSPKDHRDDAHLLKIYPHAMREANAFYSREHQGLLFGYFTASREDAGRNLPGQTVFTCLSHDIIAHETTHAIVDGLRNYFMEPTSPDTLAFHEAFADVVALFQHFSYEDSLKDTIQRTGGMLHQQSLKPLAAPVSEDVRFQFEEAQANPLVELARQFGEARGKRAALRSAIGTRPNPDLLESLVEPHDRGAILVAAIFDAFFTSYLRRTKDLFVIASEAGKDLRAGHLHPLLVDMLARVAASTASHFANMCIRALDYCPPVDIEFGDFLRALITADSDLVPEDKYEYRDALIQAFRLRGIYPDGVRSLSEDSLRWDCLASKLEVPQCEVRFDLSGRFDPNQASRNARAISKFAKANAAVLQLDPDHPIAVHTFHPVKRIGRGGNLLLESVVEVLQKKKVRLFGEGGKESFEFRGGVTLVFNPDGTLRYSVHKSIGSESRLERERAYRAGVADAHAAFHYTTDTESRGSVNFAALHRGF